MRMSVVSGLLALVAVLGCSEPTSDSGGEPAVDRLHFLDQPGETVVGVELESIRVVLRDAAGNNLPASGDVTIELTGGSADAILSGTLTRPFSGGFATFDDLAIDQVGTGYALIATATGHSSATSWEFAVTPGSLVLTRLTGDLQTGWPGEPLRDSLRVGVTDDQGVPIVGQLVNWSSVDPTGHLAPDTSRTTEAGVAAAAWVLPGPTSLSPGRPYNATARAGIGGFRTDFTATVTLGHWDWRLVKSPFGETAISSILVDPVDDDVWYVWGGGLFVTHDAGTTWTRVSAFGSRPGINRQGLVLDAADPRRVFAAVAHDVTVDGRTTLHVSEDRGLSWAPLWEFDLPNRSIYVSPRDGAIFYAPQWPDSLDFHNPPTVAPGIFRSTDGGASFHHLPYGIPFGTQVLTWDIAENPITGTLFLANEIADHPQPYRPPFLRSDDRGETWRNVARSDWWHAQYIVIDPQDGTIYTLLEGSTLWKSSDDGLTWSPVGTKVGFSLLLDAAHPSRLYIGSVVQGHYSGGLSLSADGGQGFWPIGFTNQTVSGMSLNGAGHKLYVVRFGSGIYVADVPEVVP